MTDRAADDLNLRVFSYAVAEKADLYVPVVDALVTAKERFVLQLRPSEVAQQVPSMVQKVTGLLHFLHPGQCALADGDDSAGD